MYVTLETFASFIDKIIQIRGKTTPTPPACLMTSWEAFQMKGYKEEKKEKKKKKKGSLIEVLVEILRQNYFRSYKFFFEPYTHLKIFFSRFLH